MIRYRNGAYEIVVHVGPDPVTGKERRVSRSVRRPEAKRVPAEIRALEGKLLAEVAQGQHGHARITVGETLDRWLAHVRRDLSPTTIHGYQSHIEGHLRPALGQIQVGKLTTARIDTLYNSLRASGGRAGVGLSPTTIRQVHAILRRALAQAQRWGWIAQNPATLAQPPKIRRAPIHPPDGAALARLLAADDDLADLIALAAGTGCRRGELCGLRWGDLGDHDLLIARSVIEIGHRVTVKAPKSGKVRRIAIGPKLGRRLKARRARLAARALRYGASLVPDAYILSDDIDGARPLHPNLASDRFRRHARKRGVTCRLHDLRHRSVTEALAAGMTVNDVADHHGHASAKMTLDVYGHAMPAGRRAVGDAVDVG